MGERLKGKVAIVTGSGRGIGRAHALALAAEGAKVVVNDVGAERNGAGSSCDPADQVVSEIKSRGGEAVANHDSVAEFEAARWIVQTAMDHYGRLDILVNNAGVFWHFLIHEMPEEAWDRVISVHLKGSFNMCRHAVPIMMKQRYGRIITIRRRVNGAIRKAEPTMAPLREGLLALLGIWHSSCAITGSR
jgi:NAD(P)-dependent dehydrogenase (short-subunit alcohol dehydrogenase family)